MVSASEISDKPPAPMMGGAEGADASGRAETTRQYLQFCVAGEEHAVGLEHVREIVPMAQLSRPPGLPTVAEGFLNLGGTAVCVLRLDRVLGLGDARPGMYSAIMILRAGEGSAGWLVESVHRIINGGPEELHPIPPERSFNGCATAELSVAGGTAHVLAPDRVLLETEKKILAQFGREEQRRLEELHGGGA